MKKVTKPLFPRKLKLVPWWIWLLIIVGLVVLSVFIVYLIIVALGVLGIVIFFWAIADDWFY